VVNVSDDVRNPNHLTFKRQRHRLGVLAKDLPFPFGMFQNTVSDLKGEIQSLPVLLQEIDDPQALIGMVESPRDNLIQGILPGMPKRRMTQVVSQGDGLCQILIETERFGDRSCNLRNLKGMRQSGPVMIAHWNEKDLGFMFQSPEGLGMNNSISVVLEGGSERAFLLKG